MHMHWNFTGTKLICNKCYIVVLYNVTYLLISAASLGWWHYGHANIITKVVGSVHFAS